MPTAPSSGMNRVNVFIFPQREFIARRHTDQGLRAIQHNAEIFYGWQAERGVYAEMSEDHVRSELYDFLESAKCWTQGGKPTLIPFESTQKKVSMVVDALKGVTYLDEASKPPRWLVSNSKLDPRDMLPCRNGLLHIPTRTLYPAIPALFVLNGVSYDYDPQALKPKVLNKFLLDLWPNDEESRETLQEIFGYIITPRTDLQKIPMIIGPPRGGKGTIVRLLCAVIGERNCCAPTLNGLTQQFGLQTLIDKSLAVISDMRVNARTDSNVIAERLLSISGEDAQSIPRKFKGDWNGKLSVRFLLFSNEIPWIEDSSGALASRYVVLKLTESFLGREDTKHFGKLMTELPSILNWALAGRDRLFKRGSFLQPKSAEDLIETIADLGSPVARFLADECLEGVEGKEKITCQALYNQWKVWCERIGKINHGSVQVLSRNIHAIKPLLKIKREPDGKRDRYWDGLGLKPWP